MADRLALMCVVALVGLGSFGALGRGVDRSLAGDARSAATSPVARRTSMAVASEAGVFSDFFAMGKRMLTQPRYTSLDAPGFVGKVKRLAVRLSSSGFVNGMRTRLRRLRYMTEPMEVADGHFLEISSRQPILLRGGPNVRHAQFGLRAPGDFQGQWFHLTRSDGMKSGVVRQFEGFYPGADYDIVRIPISKEAYDGALALANELTEKPRQLWLPPKYSCVTEACKVAGRALSIDQGTEVVAPAVNRVNGGLMLDWARTEGGTDVPQALVARPKTKGRTGRLVDAALGKPGVNDGPVNWGIWNTDREIRMARTELP